MLTTDLVFLLLVRMIYFPKAHKNSKHPVVNFKLPNAYQLMLSSLPFWGTRQVPLLDWIVAMEPDITRFKDILKTYFLRFACNCY